jgi:hypothetical protein
MTGGVLSSGPPGGAFLTAQESKDIKIKNINILRAAFT